MPAARRKEDAKGDKTGRFKKRSPSSIGTAKQHIQTSGNSQSVTPRRNVAPDNLRGKSNKGDSNRKRGLTNVAPCTYKTECAMRPAIHPERTKSAPTEEKTKDKGREKTFVKPPAKEKKTEGPQDLTKSELLLHREQSQNQHGGGSQRRTKDRRRD